MVILIMETTTGSLDAKHRVHLGSILCRYLKFLSKKRISFIILAILQFDEEFRGMVVRGEATDDNHSSLNELQAHHIDSSADKSSNSRPRDRGRPQASKLPNGSSKSFNRHCCKWNEDSNNSPGLITLTRVSCTIHGAVFHRSQLSPIDHILLLRQPF